MSTTAVDGIAARSARALTWGAGGAAGRVLAQIAVQVTLARLLDPVAFGQFAAVISVIGFGSIVADGGFGSALMQKKTLTEHDVALALGWCLLLGVGLALLVVLAAPWLAAQFGDPGLAPVFRVCAAWVPLLALANIPTSLLRRDLHLKATEIVQLVGYTLAFGGVAAVCALNGLGVWSLVAGFSAQSVFTLVATFAVRPHRLRPRWRGDRAVLGFGARSLATDLAGWALYNLDRLLVGRFWGLQSLGLYAVAYNLSKAPLGAFMAVAQNVAFAASARLQDDLTDLRDKLRHSLTAACFLTIPLFTLVAVESTAVLHLVYGSKWLAAAPYMAALAAAIPVMSLGMLAGGVLRGLGHVNQQMRIQLVAVVVLVGGLVALRGEPLTVAVWLVPATYLLLAGMLLAALSRHLGLSLRDTVRPVVAALVLGGVGVAAARGGAHAPATGWLSDLVPLMTGAGAMLAALLLFGRWLVGPQLVGTVTRAARARLGRTQ
jgi:O-antigen/teichoic acid export membrane protein